MIQGLIRKGEKPGYYNSNSKTGSKKETRTVGKTRFPAPTSHQLSHFCPPIATSRLNSSSLNLTAVTLCISPFLSTISNPSATVLPVAHPTTIFAFQPNPPTFFSSLISAIGTENLADAFSGSRPVPSEDLEEKETVGTPTFVEMYIQPLLPL